MILYNYILYWTGGIPFFFQLTLGCLWYLQISNAAHAQDPLSIGKSVNIRSILRYTRHYFSMLIVHTWKWIINVHCRSRFDLANLCQYFLRQLHVVTWKSAFHISVFQNVKNIYIFWYLEHSCLHILQSIWDCVRNIIRHNYSGEVIHIISFELISERPTSISFHGPSVKSVKIDVICKFWQTTIR